MKYKKSMLDIETDKKWHSWDYFGSFTTNFWEMWMFVENWLLVVLLIGLTNCAKKNNQLYLENVARDGKIEGRKDEQE